ncbi:protein-glutamate O-methyltransferase CheR [Bacillus sp. FJAT-29953]|nr:protein-glutamate O-methyltransferase CheR [Bacillus sp. FJAT-29953]
MEKLISFDKGEIEKIEINLLLEGIYRLYGFDFRNYSAAFVKRRIEHRIRTEKLEGISDLQQKIFYDPLMMRRLFYDFSINVTEMFRDPSFFLAFRTKVVPILRNFSSIRIWHVGCATGEEVLSMAILLHEEGLYEKTKLYATDMSEAALVQARKAMMPLNKMKNHTKNYLEAGGTSAFSEYYVARETSAAFHPFLTENVVYAQHNLATDQSFNEFHVIICRNVMIYFNKCLQNRVLHLLHESLSASGFLGLGSKEGIRFTEIANYYEEVDSDEKLYRKIHP